jgi:thiamine biosynthesis lipoprotein
VTVIATDCMTADALTKVVHADARRAQAVLTHFKADALLLRADKESGAVSFLDLRKQEQDPFAVAA